MKPVFDIFFDCEFWEETHIPTRHSEPVSSYSSRYVVTESLKTSYVDFEEYLYDENGEINGVRFRCDEGENYYNKRHFISLDAYPGKKVSFFSSTTGVDDDGCPEDNSIYVQFAIFPHEENEEA